MADQEKDILAHIDELVAEERELRAKGTQGGLGPEDRTRLQALEQQLDQTWDLLRQRRARAEFDEDPNAARERPVSEVEGYLQ